MKLGMMMIFVPDLAAAKQFYCDVLGFHLKAEHADRIEFEHPGCRFVAFKCRSNAKMDSYSDVARSVFVFEVSSIDESMRDMRSKGVKFLHAQPSDNDFSRYAAFTDPFGNVHEIYEPRNT